MIPLRLFFFFFLFSFLFPFFFSFYNMHARQGTGSNKYTETGTGHSMLEHFLKCLIAIYLLWGQVTELKQARRVAALCQRCLPEEIISLVVVVVSSSFGLIGIAAAGGNLSLYGLR